MANEFIARKGIVVLANGLQVTGSSQFSANISASGNITASFYYGDGSQLTGVTATGLDIDNFGADLTGITVVSTDKLPLSDGGTEGRINVSQLSTPLAGTGLEANAGTIRIASTAAGNGLTGGAGSALAVGAGSGITVNADDVALNTGSAHFISGSRSSISFTDTAGANGVDFTYTNGVVSAVLQNSAITVTAGSGLSGGGATSLGSTTTVSLDTSSVHFLDGVKKELNTEGVFSSSAQVVASSVTGIGNYAQLTGSNTFTAVNNFTNATNSTAFNNGAVVITGGLGVGGNTNISGSLTVTGLLTVTSMSTQYVTSSQLNVADNKITVQTNDLVRFGGLSVYDSGSTAATASIYWDSQNHNFIYENLSGSTYNSAMFIAGPQNTGTLGNEVGLTTGYVPVATGTDHIDSRPASSSIRIDIGTRHTHIEAGLYVTGSITSSLGFSGDGSNLTGIATTLTVSGSTSGNGTVALRTQPLIVSGTNGLNATVSNQTITISGSTATTTARGVASFTGSNFTVTDGVVAGKPINFNGTDLNLGSSYSFGLQNITSQGASTADQLNLQSGAIIRGVLFSSASATSITGPVTNQVIATVTTSSYDSAMFDYIIKDGTNFRAGTVMSVWKAGASDVEFTDTSTNDIGNTLDESFSVDISGATARLKFTAGTGTWTVKAAIRAL